jgi:hypothetical protein
MKSSLRQTATLQIAASRKRAAVPENASLGSAPAPSISCPDSGRCPIATRVRRSGDAACAECWHWYVQLNRI